MKFHLTAQQLSFYADHGYIGFENSPVDLLSVKKEVDAHKATTHRDLWRQSPSLLNTITRKLGPIALQLSRRKTLYLASDDYIESTSAWDTSCAVQTQMSFQGLACVVCLLFDGKSPCFFMAPSSWPSMMPHWPKDPSECYVIAYGDTTARYVINPKDPHHHWLKKLGFGYGDNLHKNPIIL